MLASFGNFLGGLGAELRGHQLPRVSAAFGIFGGPGAKVEVGADATRADHEQRDRHENSDGMKAGHRWAG
jgi:hypothetical protein